MDKFVIYRCEISSSFCIRTNITETGCFHLSYVKDKKSEVCGPYCRFRRNLSTRPAVVYSIWNCTYALTRNRVSVLNSIEDTITDYLLAADASLRAHGWCTLLVPRESSVKTQPEINYTKRLSSLPYVRLIVAGSFDTRPVTRLSMAAALCGIDRQRLMSWKLYRDSRNLDSKDTTSRLTYYHVR